MVTNEQPDTGHADTEVVRFTGKFHSYRVAHGPQFNAGEMARVSATEAKLLVAEGAAVRISEADEDADAKEKALSHPTRDKMVKQTATK